MLSSDFIKSFLLRKAQQDFSNQILVTRVETNRFGTTYTHKHWINVNELKDTDKVISGFNQLPADHPQQLHSLILKTKFSRAGVVSSELTHKLGKGKVQGCINSQGQRYFRIGSKTYSRVQVSDMLKKLDKQSAQEISILDREKEGREKIIDDVMKSATSEQQELYKTVGLCAGDEKAEGLIRRLKKAMDTVFYNIAKATPAFSQEKLNKVKENWRKDLTNSWNKIHLQKYVAKFNSPEQYYSFMKDLIIKTSVSDNFKKLNQKDYPFNLDSISASFSQFGYGSEKWLEDVKNGKVSESDTDAYFSYLRQSLVEGDTQVDWEHVRHETGLNLEPFVPKDSKGYSDNLKPSYPDLDVKAKFTHVSQEEYEDLFTKIVKDYKVGTYDDKTQTFSRFNTTYKVRGIYKIEGLQVEKEYQKIVSKNAKYKHKDYGGKNGADDYFYHGTATERSQKLLGESGGFKSSASVANGQIFGRGHYLAGDSSKSLTFIHGNTGNTGCLFICQGSLGNCEFGEQVFDLSIEDLESNYDSVGIPAGLDYGLGETKHAEWKINDDNAVIPTHYVEVEIQHN